MIEGQDAYKLIAGPQLFSLSAKSSVLSLSDPVIKIPYTSVIMRFNNLFVSVLAGLASAAVIGEKTHPVLGATIQFNDVLSRPQDHHRRSWPCPQCHNVARSLLLVWNCSSVLIPMTCGSSLLTSENLATCEGECDSGETYCGRNGCGDGKCCASGWKVLCCKGDCPKDSLAQAFERVLADAHQAQHPEV